MKAVLVALALFLGLSLVAEATSVSWSAVPKWQLGSVQPRHLTVVGQGMVINPEGVSQCYVMDVGWMVDTKHPAKDWVLFSPSSFCLDAGAWQLVDISLYVDPSTKVGVLKGDYFAFVGPCTYSGNIGACVASKLYFSVGK